MITIFKKKIFSVAYGEKIILIIHICKSTKLCILSTFQGDRYIFIIKFVILFINIILLFTPRNKIELL